MAVVVNRQRRGTVRGGVCNRELDVSAVMLTPATALGFALMPAVFTCQPNSTFFPFRYVNRIRLGIVDGRVS